VRIVLTGDDFGLSDETVEATVACIEAGALTGASIMVNAAASARAFQFARSRPDVSFGVHLVLVGDGRERPVVEPRGLMWN
jgi:predicted glycoside hydrolase/deacetylase ChbG (UPF0249 family)